MDYMAETPEEYGEVLRGLSDERIFDVGISKCGVFLEFVDGCDACFGAELNREKLSQLIAELSCLADRLSDA